MRKFLLYSSTFMLLNGVAEAACIKTPTCSSLGYESTTSCSGGLKCPFGNAWNCTASEIKTELTNKITELEKIIEEIKQNSSSNSDILSNCQVGDILYSDMSCNTNVEASKTPIGVIFDATNKLAIGLVESQQYWSYPDYFDVPGLSNIASSSAVTADWQGKNNTRVVLEYCKTNGKSCPAFEYVNSYKTEGTQAGDWYLPAFGELNAIYDNKDALDIVLGKIGGTKLSADSYWSSSEYLGSNAWDLDFREGYVFHDRKSYSNLYVRPVIDYGDWANSSAGDEENSSQTCDVGDILYSDMTCNANMVASKTPIGVVFDATNRLIIGLEEAQNYWSTTEFDVPGLSNITSSSAVTADWQGKNNTRVVLEYCKTNGKSCPAFEYVNSYKTKGTQAGDWYLPAMGELNAIYGNKDVLNITLGKIGGTKLSSDLYWSSSENSISNAWTLYFGTGNVDYYGKYNYRHYGYMRPVLAF